MPSFPSLFPDARTSRQTDHVSWSCPKCQVKSDPVEPRGFNSLRVEASSTANTRVLAHWLACIKIQQRFYHICYEG